MTITQEGVIRLIKSAITGQPETLPEGLHFPDVATVLLKNGLITLGYAGALNCGIPNDCKPMVKMQDMYCRDFIRSERQLEKLAGFYQALEDNGIEYMPIKGAVMKHLYPSHEMRTMDDADILIHAEQREQLEKIMLDLGYEFKSESDHEWNWAVPELKIELHKRIVSSDEKNYYSYFGDGWAWAKTKEGCRWSMSQEDAFIFEFSHFTRHYCKGGIGVRHMLDLWVHLYKSSNMDKAYIRRQMEKIKLGKFYDNIMKTLDAWFYDAPHDELTDYITDFLFGGGVSHDWEVAKSVAAGKQNGAAKQGKFKLLMRRIFPAKKHLDWNYPQFKKLPLPIAWVARWFSLLRRKNVVGERYSKMKSVTDEAINDYVNSLELVGLEVFE